MDSVSRLCYTAEKLLSLQPAGEVDNLDKTNITKHDKDTGVLIDAECVEPVEESKIDEMASNGEEDQETVEDGYAQTVTWEDPQPSKDGQENSCPSQEPEKKRRKKKKSSGKNKKPKPTGFEEFYADPPITPDQYNEEIYDIYHHSRDFIERIEQCIQRYRARRKLDSDRANILNKYLTLGGIDSTIKAFTGGLDKDTLENSTSAEIANIQARDFIRTGNPKFYDPSRSGDWSVDFEGVARGFLSHRAPYLFGKDPLVIKEYCGVVRNFLNYVTHHSVCPEYTSKILAAKKICDLADRELPTITEIGHMMPGDFNMAASTLYGGYYHGLYVSDSSWAQDMLDGEDGKDRRFWGMTIPEAERIFKTSIAFNGSTQVFHAMNSGNLPSIVEAEQRSMEVVGIVMPTSETKRRYAGVKDDLGKVGSIKPLGLLVVKHWDNPQAEEEDLTEEEEITLSKTKGCSAAGTVTEFWLEENLIEKCFIGMKFEAIVRYLDIGVKYFDSISGIYTSFFTLLPNERLDGWKEPLPNPRPAPSVDNPENLDDPVEGDEYD